MQADEKMYSMLPCAIYGHNSDFFEKQDKMLPERQLNPNAEPFSPTSASRIAPISQNKTPPSMWISLCPNCKSFITVIQIFNCQLCSFSPAVALFNNYYPSATSVSSSIILPPAYYNLQTQPTPNLTSSVTTQTDFNYYEDYNFGNLFQEPTASSTPNSDSSLMESFVQLCQCSICTANRENNMSPIEDQSEWYLPTYPQKIPTIQEIYIHE